MTKPPIFLLAAVAMATALSGAAAADTASGPAVQTVPGKGTTFSNGRTIVDPTATALPEGWGGYGAEDKRGRPFLPAGRTFADVLANVDEIAITTYQPGFLYGSDHDFDVVYDNIAVGVVNH